jgi:chromosome segregation ATPase
MVGASVFEWGLLIGAIALGLIFIMVLLTLVVAASSRREGRRISEMLEERYSRLENELQRTKMALLDAQQKARQLEVRLDEQRPEKLIGKLEQATEELEQLQRRLSESELQVGQLKQELLHRSEQQEQQRLRLEQERQHLMEEIDRWHGRYGESQLQVTRLEQELLDAQQKVEQLAQLRERLLAEMREIGNE